jgi:hypothetical protein
METDLMDREFARSKAGRRLAVNERSRCPFGMNMLIGMAKWEHFGPKGRRLVVVDEKIVGALKRVKKLIF